MILPSKGIFDFAGAVTDTWHTKDIVMLEHAICWGKVFRISLSQFQHQRSAYLLTSTTNISQISSTPQMSKRETTLKYSCDNDQYIALIRLILASAGFLIRNTNLDIAIADKYQTILWIYICNYRR